LGGARGFILSYISFFILDFGFVLNGRKKIKKKCGGHFTCTHHLLSRVLGVGSCITILGASYSFASVTGPCGVGDIRGERRRVNLQKNQDSPSLEHLQGT
jgi:hypothetical protein